MRGALRPQELEHVFEQKVDRNKHILVKVKKENTMFGLIRKSFSYPANPLFRRQYGQVV